VQNLCKTSACLCKTCAKLFDFAVNSYTACAKLVLFAQEMHKKCTGFAQPNNIYYNLTGPIKSAYHCFSFSRFAQFYYGY